MATSNGNYSKLCVDKGMTVKMISYGNEPSGSIKCGELFDKLNDSQLLLHGISYIIYIHTFIHIYIYIYIQGVPGGKDQTLGECSLC